MHLKFFHCFDFSLDVLLLVSIGFLQRRNLAP